MKLKEAANEEFKQENYEGALNRYEQAIELTPPEDAVNLSIFHNNRGLCYLKLKNDEEAKKEFTRALEVRPDYVKPRGQRMKILKEKEEYEQALEDAKKI